MSFFVLDNPLGPGYDTADNLERGNFEAHKKSRFAARDQGLEKQRPLCKAANCTGIIASGQAANLGDVK